MDSPGQVSQLAERGRELVAHLLERRCKGRIGRERRPGSHGSELQCHGHQALLRAIVKVSLDATPIYDVAIQDPQKDLPALRARYPDHATALVNLHVTYTAGVDNLEAVLRELDTIFPRWYGRDWVESRSLGPALTVGEAPAKSFEETVRDYLRQELMNEPDEWRNAILARAEALLTQVQGN